MINTFFTARSLRMRMLIVALLLVVIVGSFSALFMSRSVRAALGIPFGGLIVSVTPCTCSANFAIKIFDVAIPPLAQLPLIYQPGMTILYPFGMIMRPGAWTLGLWAPGGACLVWAGKVCVPVPTSGTMIMVGTSL